MKFHPFCEAFPLIEGEAFDELVADVKEHGLREEIWTYGGMILDGRNRLRACQQANIKPRFRAFVGSDQQAITLVKSANVHRRHLTASQRALAFAELAKWANEGRPTNPAPGAELNSNKTKELQNSTVRQAAEEAHVSDRTMHQAKAVADKGSKKLKESVRAGDVSIKKAAAVVDLPKSEQLAAAKAKPDKPAEPPPTNPVLADSWEPDEDEDAALELAEKDWKERIDKAMGAGDKLAEALAQIKQQSALIATLTLARDGYMNGKQVVTKMLKAEQRKNAKLTAELERLRGKSE